MSLLGALTPLGKVARNYKLWFRAVLAYTVAGSVSAALVGGALGTIGQTLRWEAARWVALSLTVLLSLALAAREWEWVRFRLPERKRQTESFWVHDFGFVTASAMWGAHIGLGFATRVKYGGFWALVVAILALGEPFYGAVLMMVYWLGRALPVWIAPVLFKSVLDVGDFPETIYRHDLVYRRITGAALVWSAVVMILLAVR